MTQAPLVSNRERSWLTQRSTNATCALRSAQLIGRSTNGTCALGCAQPPDRQPKHLVCAWVCPTPLQLGAWVLQATTSTHAPTNKQCNP
uniref:Uncharacterized protein n=1 Tax=Populus trichocarpa TaxID=3694 RepID=A0A2K1ZRF7_POPTR